VTWSLEDATLEDPEQDPTYEAEFFSIGAGSCVLVFNDPPDYNDPLIASNNYNMCVVATNTAGKSTKISVEVEVLPNDETAEAPEPTDDSTLPPPVPIDIILLDVIRIVGLPGTITDQTTVSVSHQTGNPTKIASIAIADSDGGMNSSQFANAASSIVLDGDDEEYFEVVGSDLRLKSGVTLDVDTKPSYTVTLRAGDVSVDHELRVVSGEIVDSYQNLSKEMDQLRNYTDDIGYVHVVVWGDVELTTAPDIEAFNDFIEAVTGTVTVTVKGVNSVIALTKSTIGASVLSQHAINWQVVVVGNK